MNFGLDRMARAVAEEIDERLTKTGIIYRIFARSKTTKSISLKQTIKKYQPKEGRLMQDVIGVRVTLYFADDIEFTRNILKANKNFVGETVDKTTTSEFKPLRVNLVFKLSKERSEEFKASIGNDIDFIDNTFEVQLRTVFSEGWHEVDHDLRYKCREDWDDHQDLERAFNGVFASLETHDWSNLMIFKTLAHRHYKSSKWSAMLRTKFRLRFEPGPLDTKIIDTLNKNEGLAKDLYRLDRQRFLQEVSDREIRIPLSINNLIYLSNCMFLGNKQLYKLTPRLFLSDKHINRLVN